MGDRLELAVTALCIVPDVATLIKVLVDKMSTAGPRPAGEGR